MSSLLEQTFERSMYPFVLMFLCLKNKIHPLNTTSANDTVIPGKDQGSDLNASTKADDKRMHPTAHEHKIPGPSQE